MKNNFIIVFMTLIFLSGCIKDTLDRKPLNMISDADVWTSEELIDIYMNTLYNNLPMGFVGEPYLTCFTDESTSTILNWPVPVSNYGNLSLARNPNMYSWIRKANYFLERVKSATISESSINKYVAECRFIRAFYYFDLVKKYGGMPIIKEVQSFNNNLEELQVPRNTEEEVYDFISDELDAAIADLPDAWNASNSNRATKMVAQALKSRAMLYAGSIAKYGTVQLNGLIGIPASKANAYFTKSLNAAKAVMESNIYGLYDKSYNPIAKTGDPVKNFTDIFLDKNNKEIIFQKAYVYPEKTHDYDYANLPRSYLPASSGSIGPLLGLVESFEYIDGTPGTLNIDGLEFDSPDDLFKDKDPRFSASIFRSESPYIGKNVQIYRGIYDTDGTLYDLFGAPFPKDPSVMQVGRDGPFPTLRYTKSGFYVRKMINQSRISVEGWCDQNYIEIRYAEVLLNYAESALELGTNFSEALDAINQIRNRAGIKLLNSGELTIDRLRNERKVELAFEDKRFWDIRRWRIGTNLFKNTFMEGLYPYLKYTGSGYKYIFKKISGYPLDEGLSRIYEEKDYYSNLSDYISGNKNIINNPGW